MASLVTEVTAVPPDLQHLTPSKPAEELPGGITAAAIRNCKELYMGHKGIDVLWGFDRFVNLEVLWLNNNAVRQAVQIVDISGLDACVRLKELYVHNNSISSLEGSLPNFRFLSTLVIAYNRLAGLDSVLAILSKLRFLKELELHDNPCAQELHYKQRVLAACPGLEVFDRHIVKPSEVAAAKARFGKRTRGQAKRVAQTLKAPSGPLGVPMASRRRGEAAKSTARAERSKISQLLDAEARQIRKRAKAREEAAVEELFLSGSLAARSSQAVRGMDPISALTSTLSDADTGVVAAAVGASMAQRGVHAADTTALSRAGWGLVTEASQKPLTQSMRELATRPDVTYAPVAMEFKPTPAVAARMRDSRAASIAAGGATHASGAQHAAPGAQALGPWEQYHLRRLFEDSDTNGDGKLSPEELLQVLGRLGEHGVVLDGPDAGAAAATVVQLLLAQHDSDGDGRLSWKEFFGAVTGSVTHAESRDASHAAFAGASTVRLPAVRFRCLTAHEAREKSDALLAAGQRLQRRIMKSSPTSPELPELQAKALKFGEQGSRLAALASKLEGKYDPAEPPAQPLPSRHDYYEASALVPVHEAVKTRARGGRSYTVKPPGEESDSDTDESDSDRVVGDDDFDAYRKVRKARKPHVVLTQATHLSASRGRSR